MARNNEERPAGSAASGHGEQVAGDPRITDREVVDVQPGPMAGTDRVEPVTREAAPPPREAHEDPSVDVRLPEGKDDQIRWGPVWAGLIVALATFLLLEIGFYAAGWLTLDPNDPGTTAGWISGIIGLLAFLLGGLTAGATAKWNSVRTGLLHGIVVWALGVVAFLFLTLFGGASLLGNFGDVAAQVLNLNQLAGDVPDIGVQQAVDSTRDAASWAFLGLGLSIIASAVGGLLGAKLWSGRENDDDVAEVHTERR